MIIVLGHTGFLGRCLYDNFLKDQQYRVFGFSSAQIDLTSQESATRLCDITGCDTTVIMAAGAMVKVKDFDSFRREVSMFINLANPGFLSRISHLICISGTAIYGHHSESTITESSRPKPDDLYSLAKFIGELILKQSCADFEIPLTIVRPGIIYGQGDARSPLFRFVKNVKLGEEIEIFGDNSTRLFWVHKLDLFRIISSIIKDSKVGDYNIVSDDNGVSLVDLAEIVFKACKIRTGIKFVPSAKVSPSLKFDTSKFSADFPGFEFTRLEDGIKDYMGV